MTKRKKKHVQPVVRVTAPHGAKVVVKRKKRNPYVLQVGGQKRKIRLAAGRIKDWKEV